MNRYVKILFSMLLGGWAGLLAWLILDFIVGRRMFDSTFGSATTLGIYGGAAITGALVGLFAGMLITGLERWNNSSEIVSTLVGAVIGIVAGVLGGMLGLLIAEVLFQNIPLPGDLPRVSRVVGWALFGLGVGLALGIVTWSRRKTAASSVGGFLGGILGGLALVALSTLANFPMTGRALGFVVLGACVGLLIAVVQTLVQQADLRVISGGRNEGRDFAIDKRSVKVGSGGRSDWKLADDPHLQPEHIEIRQEKGVFTLQSLNPNAATAVNNQRVTAQTLRSGDRIQIGSTLLVFSVRKP